MSADQIPSSDDLKKAMRKYEKKLRQISHLEEQNSFRELTKEELNKVYTKQDVQKELDNTLALIKSINLLSKAVMDDDESAEDLNTTMTENIVPEAGHNMTPLTPTKRSHMVSAVLTQTEATEAVDDEVLIEPDSKKRKKKNDEITEPARLRQTWCNQHFVVSKMDGHNDVVSCLDCNQDLLLTGSRDTSLKVWSLRTFEMLHHMGGHSSTVTGVRLVPGSELQQHAIDLHNFTVGLSGSLDCSVKAWNLVSGQLICSVYVFSPVTCMDYWCEQKVIIGTEGGKIDVWNLCTGENVYTVRHSGSNPATCLKVVDGHVYCADSSVQKWLLGSGNHASLILDTGHLVPNKKSINCMLVHLGDVFWGDNGVSFKECNCLTGVLKKHPTHCGRHVFTGAMVVAGDAILCAGYDKDQGISYINVHCVHDGQFVCTISDNSSKYITCMACPEPVTEARSKEGKLLPALRIITGGDCAELKVWDMSSDDYSSVNLSSKGLKSYQQLIKTPPYTPLCEQSRDSEYSDDDISTRDDRETDIDLYNQPLPNPQLPAAAEESSSWQCSIL